MQAGPEYDKAMVEKSSEVRTQIELLDSMLDKLAAVANRLDSTFEMVLASQEPSALLDTMPVGYEAPLSSILDGFVRRVGLVATVIEDVIGRSRV